MTEPHVFDELPGLLRGEADRTSVIPAATHLRGCEDCQQELISAVVAHAALSSAVRIAPDFHDAFSHPPDAVSLGDSHSGELPDLSALFVQARSEAQPRRIPRLRGSSTRWLAAAAIVVAVAAGGSVAGVVATSGSSSGHAVALAAFDHGSTSASLRVDGNGRFQVNASALPSLAAGEYYEVWLTDSGRTAMAPVGQLNQSRRGSFDVPETVMSAYSAVEVSVQHTATTGGYSGVSVLRGSY